MFLTRAELKQLTGTADRQRQAVCLRANRIPFTLDVFGRPVVTRSTIEGQKKADEAAEKWPGPSFLRAA
jgi:hypothetical protein